MILACEHLSKKCMDFELSSYGGFWFMIEFRTVNLVQMCPPLVAQVAPAVGLVLYTIWGLGPTLRFIRKIAFKVLFCILIPAVSFSYNLDLKC